MPRADPPPGQAFQEDDWRAEFDAVQRVQEGLVADGRDDVAFVLDGAGFHLIEHSAAVDGGRGPYPRSLVLVDGAVPEPWRRLPTPVADAVPAASADVALLERTLRERLPGAAGASESEIAAAEVRLGVPLPEELRAVYRVAGETAPDEAIGCELYPLRAVFVADAASRPCEWDFAADEAVSTPPDAAVQGLVGSPGWIVFGDSGGGDWFAVDLTPGPGGHVGQVIFISHEENVGASLVADSLTDLVLGRRDDGDGDGDGFVDEMPLVARVNARMLRSVEAAVDPRLEVLDIGVSQTGPFSLAPVAGLPRLRTLSAHLGTLADPLEVTGLPGLEFLSLGTQEWRLLLDAGAVPDGLLAAGLEVRGTPHPLSIVSLANELLALRGRPLITHTVIPESS